jgi:hypothetical protein
MRSFLLLIPLLANGQGPSAVFGTTVVIPSGLLGNIYYLPRNTATLADLPHLHPKGTIYTTSLNVPPQDFLIGFPGITQRFEWFAIDYSGKFWIETPGLYGFASRRTMGPCCTSMGSWSPTTMAFTRPPFDLGAFD